MIYRVILVFGFTFLFTTFSEAVYAGCEDALSSDLQKIEQIFKTAIKPGVREIVFFQSGPRVGNSLPTDSVQWEENSGGKIYLSEMDLWFAKIKPVEINKVNFNDIASAKFKRTSSGLKLVAGFQESIPSRRTPPTLIVFGLNEEGIPVHFLLQHLHENEDGSVDLNQPVEDAATYSPKKPYY